MNQDKDTGYTIYCSRCGAEMNSNARYCMKCGNLNYEHADNEKMKVYRVEEESEVNDGKFFTGSFRKKKEVSVVTGDKMGSPKKAFLFTIVLYLLFILLNGALNYLNCDSDLNQFIASPFSLITVIVTCFFVLCYSVMLLFMKCNKPWWAALIPIYNVMILSDIAFEKSLLGLVFFIPIIGFFFFLILLYRLGKKFQCNGFLTAIFPFIMIPVIGFSSRSYKGVSFVAGEELALEKNYRRKKDFLVTALLFFVLGISLLIYGNYQNLSQDVSIMNYYYTWSATSLVKKIEKNVEEGNIICTEGVFEKGRGVYYFHYVDISKKVFMPLSFYMDPISAYVKLDYSTGEGVYSLSVTDGSKGFEEVLFSELDSKMVKEYQALTIDRSDVNICDF